MSVSQNEFAKASLQHLDSNKGRFLTVEEIIKLPIEQMAEYADPVARKYCNDLGFLQNQVDLMGGHSDTDINERLNHCNATSFGNYAYLAVNCADEKYKNIWKTELDKLIAASILRQPQSSSFIENFKGCSIN